MAIAHCSCLVFVALQTLLAMLLWYPAGDTFTDIKIEGSVPPVPAWFRCVRELRDKPYDRKKSQDCLRSLLAHPGMKGGEVTLRRAGANHVVEFRLKAVSLRLSDVDYGVGHESDAVLQDLLSRNGNVLGPGEVYDHLRDSSTGVVIDVFLRSHGRQAAISRKVYLDYRTGTARLSYAIWDGPPTSPQRPVPPYAEPCSVLVGYFNWTDVDDLSPLSFVKRAMKTQWLSCFSAEAIREDEATLKDMKFLKEARILVEGFGDSRQVSVHLRGQPLRVAQVSLHRYGLLKSATNGEKPELPVEVGVVYRRSLVRETLDTLEKFYSKPGIKVRAYEDVQVNADGEIAVDFGVLGYPDDEVFIDGSPVDMDVSTGETQNR